MRSIIVLALAIALVSACSSKPAVTSVPAAAKELAGVPFRMKAEQTVRVFQLTDSGGYDEVSVSKQTFADFSRLYAIDVRSDVLASPSLHVAYGADNTIKTMQITSAPTASGTIDAATQALNGVTTAESTKAAARLTNAQAALTADKAVKDAQDALDALPSTASTDARAAYQRVLESARRQAEIARAAAGLAP